MIQDLDNLRGHDWWVQACTFHASYLIPFNEPYIKPLKISIEGTECQNLFRFQCSAAKGAAKWIVEQPDFILRRADCLGAYARAVLERGTYCPACVWFAFRVWIPRMLR